MREPDLVSEIARAWKFEPDADHPTGLGSYVVNGPYHPLWRWWYVGLVSLRDAPGVPPAKKHFPEAEYEILCLSLDPTDGPPNLDKLDVGDLSGMPPWLQPPDWVVQFHRVNDEQAVEILDLAAKAIVNGQSCDSDYRSWWQQAIPTTVKHVLGEPH